MRKAIFATLALAVTMPCPARAKVTVRPEVETQALELSKQTLAMRSVRGEGNQTADVARAIRTVLLGAGWAEQDIEITPVDDTAYLVATWPGSDPSLKPLIVSGHMDVVEADPKDWTRDPFTPVIENGFLFARGANDMKVDNALAIAALAELRRSGLRPRRTIIVAYSGDEETSMKTSQILVKRLPQAELVIAPDYDLNGVLDPKSGQPLYYVWHGAEKSYADFALTVTNPGGHSSVPRADNAINQLAAALVRIGQHVFPSESHPLTRTYFAEAAKLENDPTVAGAMKAFAADPTDPAALAVLRADPELNALVQTTCVVTQISGGHAVNALPQRVTANVNCRIFPGHSRAEIAQDLRRIAADPEVQVEDVTEGAVESPASPLRADLAMALTRAIRIGYPKVPVMPSMAKGASDCMLYRAAKVDCYITSPLFMKNEDYRSHGLNERVPLAAIRPGLAFYLSLIPELTR